MHKPASAKWTTVVYLYTAAMFGGLVSLWQLRLFGIVGGAPVTAREAQFES